MQNRKRWMTMIGLAAVTALATPAGFASGEHGGGHGSEGRGHGGGHDFAFGKAAPNARPDRTVEIVARDNMRFEPSVVRVQPGETVRFVVRNVGEIQHSFTLGSPRYQRQHEQEMQGMALENMASHMEGSSNGIVVQPGRSDALTWQFQRGGPVQFACHIPGHYPAGMKGRVHLDREDSDEVALLAGEAEQ